MAQFNNSPAGKGAEISKTIETVLGVEPHFIAQFDRLQIRTDDRVQSRIDKNSAPKFMVERYANQMGEFHFPPIVITESNGSSAAIYSVVGANRPKKNNHETEQTARGKSAN
jgi:hypothetical protein